MVYSEIFRPGMRVRVKAGFYEGSDHLINGRAGTVMEVRQESSALVHLDKPLRDWPNPTDVCCHNLVTL